MTFQISSEPGRKWHWRVLAALPALLAGCSDPAGDDDEDDPFDEVTVDDVCEVVEGGCTAEGLAMIAGAEPEAVRAALVEVDQGYKLDEWTAGLTHGNQVGELPLRTELLGEFAFDYSLYVPEGYAADPEDPLPLYLDPGHPADDLESEIMPYMAGLLDEPMVFVQDNMFNRLYTDLGEDDYYDQVVYADEFETVAAYQDHQEIIGEIFRQLRQRFHIDSSRIYVGGVSAEGNASWSHGMLSSDQYAAILPVSAGTAAYHEEVWRNLENVGMLVVHGTEDTLCPVEDVDEAVAMLEGWGFDVEYWREEGEGHGTMFFDEYVEMVDWLLLRERPLQPPRVHRAIKSDRDLDAYWLAAVELTAELNPEATIHVTAPPAVLDATWSGGTIEVEATGVTSFEVRWMEGDPGTAAGAAGDTVSVQVNGADLGNVTLAEDPIVAVESYCQYADIARLWAGRTVVEVP